MKIEIRLKAILARYGLFSQGVFKEICKSTGLNRETVSRLYNNEGSHSLKSIALLCDWLLGKLGGRIQREMLLQELLGTEPDALWQAISRNPVVTVYVGERQSQRDGYVIPVISRRDGVVSTLFLQHLWGMNRQGTASVKYVPFWPDTAGPDATPPEDLRAYSRDVFKAIRAAGSDYTAIFIGSQQVCYPVEHFIANLCGCKPFEAGEDKPRVPFHVVYRSPSPRYPSCFGGPILPGQKKPPEAGTYFQDREGNWKSLPWKKDDAESGVVVAVRDGRTNTMELGVWGLSGWGTEAMGRALLQKPEKFWPLGFRLGSKEIGVFICGFRTHVIPKSARDEEQITAENLNVTAMPDEVLKRFLARH